MYNGAIGGIGEGLQSFVTAYQTALNYQLAKKQQAALENYQDVMSQAALKNSGTETLKQQSEAQYQTGMLGVEQNKIPIGQAEANAKFLEMGGTPAAQYYGFKPSQNSLQSDQLQTTQPAPQAPARGLVNPLPPGMVGPQPSQGMVNQSQQRAQGLMNQQQPTSGMLNKGNGPPEILPTFQRQFNMEQQKEANKLNAESQGKGTAQTWGIDPRTGGPTLLSQGPYTGEAALGLEQKKGEILNQATNQRSGNITAVNQFNDDVDTKAARASASPMNRIVQFMNKPNMSPADKEAAFAAAINVMHPETGSGAKTIDDLMKAPGASDRLKNELSKIEGAGLDDNTLNQTISAAADAHIANTQGMQQASQYAKKQAQFRGLQQDPGLQINPSVTKAYNSALALKKNLPAYIQPANRPNPSWLEQASGFLSGSGSNSAPQMTIQQQAQAEMSRRKIGSK